MWAPNGQHAFFQLLHQGTDVIPVDFVLVAEGDGPADMQAKLLASGVAQAEALMVGRPEAEVRLEMEAKDMDPAEIDALAPQRTFPGEPPLNHPRVAAGGRRQPGRPAGAL